MFGSRKGNVYAGKTTGRSAATGVFSEVKGPGLGRASTMDRRVFDKAVKSANDVLRGDSSSARGTDGRRR
ncbi:hypothetical protein [Methylobacterium platani]|uniref:hypothetical protein n=1 Tax=Methylobacterium platani TaxID=427683 RepID=UPI000AF8F78F|nr:hypothetical protein [Methylobacterium platani]